MSEESEEKLSQPLAESKGNIPASKGNVLRSVEKYSETYYGPLPRPSDLQEYDRIVPGAADRIIRMAENQAQHRQNLEKTVVIGDSRRAFCGLLVGALVALCVLGGAVFLIYEGHDWAGTVIAGLDIVSLVSVFVYGSRSRRQERIQKAEVMNSPSRDEES